MGVGADGISVIADSIQDWIDPDDNPRLAGAESDYYQSLNPPYYAKNAPIDDLSELLLVKGIAEHPEIYWGGSATNHVPAAFQRKLGFVNSPFQAANYPFGLKDIFTPLSTGRININTADANVLQMLPGRGRNHRAKYHQVARRPGRRGRHRGRHPHRQPRRARASRGSGSGLSTLHHPQFHV